MANLPPGFLEALATKYAVLDRDSKARSGLEDAQTAQVAPNAAAQRAVQAAQIGQIQAQTDTIGPLAQSQINQGYANIGETQARGGFFNAQSEGVRHGFNPAIDDVYRDFARSVGGLPEGDRSGTGNATGGAPTTQQNEYSVTDPQNAAWRKFRPNNGNGIMNTDGMVPGAYSPSGSGITLIGGDQTGPNPFKYSKGTTSVPVPPKGKGMPGYAEGTRSVPAPGQTVTTGSWEGPTPAPPATGNQLARAAGLPPRVPRPQTYKRGTTKVPGQGSSKVDTVPAMLAPREAVLNEHAADLIGRDKITAANAAGNHIAGFAKGVTHVGRGLAAVLGSLGQTEGQVKKAPATKGMP
jgi:hypothetical protein